MIVDKENYLKLVLAISGLVATYCTSNYLLEAIFDRSFRNILKQQDDKFTSPVGILMWITFTSWIIARVLESHFKETNSQPQQQSPAQAVDSVEYQSLSVSSVSRSTENIMGQLHQLVLGVLKFLSSMSLIYLASQRCFPIAMVIKCVPVLSLINFKTSLSQYGVRFEEIGLFFKLSIVIFTIIGSAFFVYAEPSSKKTFTNPNIEKTLLDYLSKYKIYLSVAIFLLSDLLRNSMEAKTANKYVNFRSIYQKVAVTNKWAFLVSLAFATILREQSEITVFMWLHPEFAMILFVFGLLYLAGEMQVLYFYETFRQKLGDFLTINQNLLSVGISILAFEHRSNTAQFEAIMMVMSMSWANFIFDNGLQIYISSKLKSVKSKRKPKQKVSVNQADYEQSRILPIE